MGKVKATAEQKDKDKDNQVEKRPASAVKEDVKDDEIQLAADTLVGDLRDAVIGKIKTLKKPWEKMSESEQRDTVQQVTNACTHLTKRTVELIAKNGRHTINATLESFTVKDGVKAVIKAPTTEEAILQLTQAQGHPILLVASASAQYEGERAPAKLDPDQSDMIAKLGATTPGKGSSAAVETKVA